MKRIHPNSSRSAIVVAFALATLVAGCRGPNAEKMNPFLAPDRVPPPATRVILPGQAQPYYPGDPLPVMQSRTSTTPSEQSDAAEPQPTQLSAAGLIWGAPGGTAPLASTPTEPRMRALASEPAVAIPTDSESLRFAPVAPETEVAGPVASIAAAAPSQTPQPSAFQAPQPVVQAAYETPLPNQQLFAATTSAVPSLPPIVTSPWRSPQIVPQSEPAPSNAVASGVQPIVTVPATMPASPMFIQQDVRLRAVPSPPPAIDSTAPRIRPPGYAVPMGDGTPGATMPAGVPQTLQITPVPVGYNLAAMPQAAASGDGFRPRSKMR